MDDNTDNELIALLMDPARRNQGFSVLIKKYQSRVYWHIRRIVTDHDDANDVVQNVFIKAWKAMDSYRADAKLFTWLYRIATNESITFLRKKKANLFSSFEDVGEAISETLAGDEYFKGDEIQLKLQKAIQILPEKQKLVFQMRYYDELPYEEISKILGTSVGGLKASYHHAVQKIENYLKDH